MRQRGDDSELRSRSYLGQCDAIQRNDRRRDSHKHRIQSGRSRGSRVLASNRPCRQGFSAATGRSEWGSVERGRWRMTRSNGRAKGCWERIEEEDGRAAGSAKFYRR